MGVFVDMSCSVGRCGGMPAASSPPSLHPSLCVTRRGKPEQRVRGKGETDTDRGGRESVVRRRGKPIIKDFG